MCRPCPRTRESPKGKGKVRKMHRASSGRGLRRNQLPQFSTKLHADTCFGFYYLLKPCSCTRRAIWCRRGRAWPLGRIGGGAACMRALVLVCGLLLQSASSVTVADCKKSRPRVGSRKKNRDRELITVPLRPIRVTVRAGWNESRAGSTSGPRYGTSGRTNRGKRNRFLTASNGRAQLARPASARPALPRPLPPRKPRSPRSAPRGRAAPRAPF
jgi:hypothetical protein